MIGTSIAHYQITAKLGQGGMGEVYRATDTKLGREVAIKWLPDSFADDKERRARFEREAKALAQLNHPHVASIYEFGEFEGKRFLTMELVEGDDLSVRLHEGALSVDDALAVGKQIAEALEAAHEKGIVHRDLKPANIKLTGAGHVKVLDFGLAKAVDEGDGSRGLSHHLSGEDSPTITDHCTMPGALLGTAAYMSPEQARGEQVDPRSDVWSFGCVLYECLTGRKAFKGATEIETLASILKGKLEWNLLPNETPVSVKRLLKGCLTRELEHRLESMDIVLSEVIRGQKESFHGPHLAQFITVLKERIKPPMVLGPFILILVLISFFGISLSKRLDRENWARSVAIPMVREHIAAEEFSEAFRLAESIAPIIGDDPELSKVWPEISVRVDISSTPSGATFLFKDYGDLDGDWIVGGTTPVRSFPISKGWKQIRVQLDGFRVEERRFLPRGDRATGLNLSLHAVDSSPEGMVYIDEYAPARITLTGLDHLAIPLSGYWIDKYEVSNQSFANFVTQGGYHNSEYWKFPFIKEGREIEWEDAIGAFVDATGFPGPATWEVGTFPSGEEDYRVRGISWYEAAAYAEFVGKSLPNILQWSWAGNIFAADTIIRTSNFQNRQPLPIGASQSITGRGVYDMAGNVKEWCLNSADSDDSKRYVLGGAWDEEPYMFYEPNARSPWLRNPRFGFRCVKSDVRSAEVQGLTGVIELPSRSYEHEEPVADDEFRLFADYFSYDRTDLVPEVQAVAVDSEIMRVEKVSLVTAYGGERMDCYLYLPRVAATPYQAVVHFPGSPALRQSAFKPDLIANPQHIGNAIVRSGRAFVFPIYKSTYERQDGYQSDRPETTVAYRRYLVFWYQDLARTLDYLEQRKDIDKGRLAYQGTSWGAALGPIFIALESRFTTGILHAGGLRMQRGRPETEQIHYAPRVRVPVLMLNGVHDFFFPLESSQKPMAYFLGLGSDHVVHKTFPSGHIVPRRDEIRETISWLNQHLGKVDSL